MNLLNIMLNMDVHWPEGAKLAVQDGDGSLKWGFHDIPAKFHCDAGVWHRGKGFNDPVYGRIELADDYETCIILKEDYQKAGGWIEWAGGDCPVNEGQMVEYRMRGASTGLGVDAGSCLRWNHNLRGTGEETIGDIIAYRLLHQEEQQNPEATIAAEASEDVKDAVPEVVTQTLKDKLKVIQDIRMEINNTKVELQKQEETLKILIAEVNNQMQAYGFTLKEQNDNTEEPPIITDWQHLQKGDVIIARGEEWNTYNRDKELVVEDVEYKGYRGSYRIMANNDWGKDFEFVSRPTKK